MIREIIFKRDNWEEVVELSNGEAKELMIPRTPFGVATFKYRGNTYREGDVLLFINGVMSIDVVEVDIDLIRYSSGDWEILCINGVPLAMNHTIDVMYKLKRVFESVKSTPLITRYNVYEVEADEDNDEPIESLIKRARSGLHG